MEAYGSEMLRSYIYIYIYSQSLFRPRARSILHCLSPTNKEHTALYWKNQAAKAANQLGLLDT